MPQGRLAVLHATGRPHPTTSVLPIAIFTIPEISAVGRTEDACRKEEVPNEVGVAGSGLIHVGVMPVQMKGTPDDLLGTVFDHPTLSERYRIAAVDGTNRL